MDGRQPEQISEVLATLLDKGDTGNVADLYEDEAVFADFDATVTGLDDILRAHQQFSDAGRRLILNESVVFEVDDIALVHWSWTVRNADGSSREGISAEVLRRQPDGTWKQLRRHGACQFPVRLDLYAGGLQFDSLRQTSADRVEPPIAAPMRPREANVLPDMGGYRMSSGAAWWTCD